MSLSKIPATKTLEFEDLPPEMIIRIVGFLSDPRGLIGYNTCLSGVDECCQEIEDNLLPYPWIPAFVIWMGKAVSLLGESKFQFLLESEFFARRSLSSCQPPVPESLRLQDCITTRRDRESLFPRFPEFRRVLQLDIPCQLRWGISPPSGLCISLAAKNWCRCQLR